jgi:hypothetical protein
MMNKESQTVEYKQNWRNDSLLKYSIMPDLLNYGGMGL